MRIDGVIPPPHKLSSPVGRNIRISTNRFSAEVSTSVVVGSDASFGSQRIDSRTEMFGDIQTANATVNKVCNQYLSNFAFGGTSKWGKYSYQFGW